MNVQSINQKPQTIAFQKADAGIVKALMSKGKNADTYISDLYMNNNSSKKVITTLQDSINEALSKLEEHKPPEMEDIKKIYIKWSDFFDKMLSNKSNQTKKVTAGDAKKIIKEIKKEM